MLNRHPAVDVAGDHGYVQKRGGPPPRVSMITTTRTSDRTGNWQTRWPANDRCNLVWRGVVRRPIAPHVVLRLVRVRDEGMERRIPGRHFRYQHSASVEFLLTHAYTGRGGYQRADQIDEPTTLLRKVAVEPFDLAIVADAEQDNATVPIRKGDDRFEHGSLLGLGVGEFFLVLEIRSFALRRQAGQLRHRIIRDVDLDVGAQMPAPTAERAEVEPVRLTLEP